MLVSEPDQGIDDALNKGLARASGDVVGLLHADGLYADSAVLARIAAAFADPTVEAVYGDLVSIARQDTRRVVRYWRAGDDAPARLRRGWMPPHPTSPRMPHPPPRSGAWERRHLAGSGAKHRLFACHSQDLMRFEPDQVAAWRRRSRQDAGAPSRGFAAWRATALPVSPGMFGAARQR